MREKLRNYINVTVSNKNLSTIDTSDLNYFITLVENRVISNIKDRQKKIPDLIIEDNRVRYGGDLTPGCHNCLTHGLNVINPTWKCNAKCKFCYHYGVDNKPLTPLHYMWGAYPHLAEDLIQIATKIKGDIHAIAWLGGEPILEFEKLPKVIKKFTELNISQHIFTNGIAITEDHMKILSDCGLGEIRFNLAATNCSDDVIKKMNIARKYFKYVCIEIPMHKEFYNDFMFKRIKILDTGFDHMNINELHLNENNIKFFNEDLYMYRFGYVSPISSRQLTYDLLEVASAEKWPIVINDCSNEQKFYRGIGKHSTQGYVSYFKQINLTQKFFHDNVNTLSIDECEKIMNLVEGK